MTAGQRHSGSRIIDGNGQGIVCLSPGDAFGGLQAGAVRAKNGERLIPAGINLDIGGRWRGAFRPIARSAKARGRRRRDSDAIGESLAHWRSRRHGLLQAATTGVFRIGRGRVFCSAASVGNRCSAQARRCSRLETHGARVKSSLGRGLYGGDANAGKGALTVFLL